MKGWKWILATAALMIGVTGGAFAQEQRWSDRRDRDTDGASAQRYESNQNYNRRYSRNDSYRRRDGDRDDQGYWRQSRDRDNRNQDRSGRDRQERERDRD
jgi:hypothetical protein